MGDGGDEERDHLVTVKPQFEGKAGEEVINVCYPNCRSAISVQEDTANHNN